MEMEKNQVRLLRIINRMLQKLRGIIPEYEFYQIVAESLHELVPQSVVFVNAYDSISGLFQLRAIYDDAINMKQIALSMGTSPVGMSMPLNHEMKSAVLQGRLVRLCGGIYNLGAGMVTPEVCTAIERQFNIMDVYTIGFTCEDVLFGSACFLLRSQGEAIDVESVESLVRIVSGYMQNRSLELTVV